MIRLRPVWLQMVEGDVDLRNAILTDHVIRQMTKRQVTETEVRSVLARPGQVLPAGLGRVVVQSIVPGCFSRQRLLRVFVDVERRPPEVVTAYLTSKVAKYWSPE